MYVILVFLLTFFNIFFVYSLDLPVSRISDDSILRNRLRNSWFLDTPDRVLSQHTRIEFLQTGERVQVSATEGRRDEIIIFLAREQMTGSVSRQNGFERRQTGNFPGWAQGSWILTRNKTTGAGTSIRILLHSNAHTYIQFRPLDSDKALMDAVLYGAYITRSMPFALPPSPTGAAASPSSAFERLYTMPLNDILKLVGDKFPLHYFEPDPSIYRDTWAFVSQVRRHLGGLRWADDGAIDENGNYVFIETLQRQPAAAAGLNCSGFTKWLIDGMLRPITGKRLTIPQLKKPFGIRGSIFTEHWEERWDLFFGLDWIRNLAAEANSVLRSPAYGVLDEFEVRRDNFLFLRRSVNGIFEDRSYPGFLNEVGYGIEGLYPLLYTLAIDEPYTFYLAAVNRERDNPASRQFTPRLREYFHVAALIPYFDEFGIFRVVVFESNAETSFSTFRHRYPAEHHINLVKIPIPARFEP
jgi:hypothetical protein